MQPLMHPPAGNVHLFVIEALRDYSRALRNGICQWNRLWVNIAEIPSDRRQNCKRDGTHRTDDDGVEDGRLLARRPAEVAEGSRPELRGRHCHGSLRGSCREKRVGSIE